jgi:PKD repeat protein
MGATAKPPEVLISYPVDGATFRASEAVELNASLSFDPEGKPVTIHWTSDKDGDLGHGAVKKLKLSPGGHIITCEVVDDDGESASDSREVMILPLEPPVAVLQANKTDVEIFELIQFSAMNSSDDFNIVEYKYDFDDGYNTGWVKSNRTEHSFVFPGTYTVTLEVKDNDGLTSSATITIKVRNRSTNKDTTEDDRNCMIFVAAGIIAAIIVVAVIARRMVLSGRKAEADAFKKRMEKESGRRFDDGPTKGKRRAHKVMQPKRKKGSKTKKRSKGGR